MSLRIRRDTAAARLAKLQKVMRVIVKASLISNVDHVLRLILHSAREITGTEAVSLMLLDPHSDVLHFHMIEGGSPKVKSMRLRSGQGIAGQVARTGHPMLINDTRHSRYFYPGVDKDTGFLTRQILCVPLRIHLQGRVIGVLEAINKLDRSRFGDEDVLVFTAFANQTAVAIENMRLADAATHDSLTKVFNREHFDARLESELVRARRLKKPLSILLLDVDHFKRINDHRGHQAGDRVLAELARILTRCVRGSDVVARYGGDEMALILTETPGDKARLVAERIVKAVRENAFVVDGRRIAVTVSIGISSLRQASGSSAAASMRESDAALYEAKKSRDRAAAFHPA